MVIKTELQLEKNHREEFKAYTENIVDGIPIMSPRYLNSDDRRLYIRRTMREDHTYRIKSSPEDTQQKFDKLYDSYFSFFRGTALLYYRDYAGIDHELPVVFTIGDIHPENFGVMPNKDDVPFFGVNDFDEAHFAPFTYDVRRGAVGFYLSTKENGFSKKKRKKIVRAFVEGYLDGLREFAKDDREKFFQYRMDNSPKLIKKLLEDSLESRKSFLKEKIHLKKKKFRVTEEVVPYSHHIEEFQKVVDKYVKKNKIKVPKQHKNFFKVTDVAIKKGSGTASLGLDRYWILLEGETDAADDCVILEMKQSRISALQDLVPFFTGNEEQNDAKAEQIVKAHDIHLVGGDAMYGYAKYEDKSYLMRERSPYKNDFDTEDLGKKQFKKYARVCGKTLAQTHARSDQDTGVMDGNAEEEILQSIIPHVFVDDMVRFAHRAAKRIVKDHQLFQKDYDIGAFDFMGNQR